MLLEPPRPKFSAQLNFGKIARNSFTGPKDDIVDRPIGCHESASHKTRSISRKPDSHPPAKVGVSFANRLISSALSQQPGVDDAWIETDSHDDRVLRSNKRHYLEGGQFG